MRPLLPLGIGLSLSLLFVACGDKDGDSGTTDTDTDTDGTTDTDTDTDGTTDTDTTDTDTDTDTDGGTGEAVVVVSGAVYLGIGESVSLDATTVNAEDSAYTWGSSDDGIATVDSSGVVTGVGPGEVTITATGDSSGVSGTVGLYVADSVPFLSEWAGSGHADRTAEAFNHWNEDGAIPTTCARCHSKPGYLDWLGADGTAADTVDSEAVIGTVIDCETCHDPAAADLSHATFPSGAEIDDLGSEARCIACHQGRTAGADVDADIEELGLTESLDTVSEDLGFANIHYYPAAATLYASQAAGGYQYEGKVYDWRFRHVEDFNACAECHDPHTTKVRVDECGTCHTGVEVEEDLRNIRMMASLSSDYDGDGNTTEGIAFELDGLGRVLLEDIQAYTAGQELGDICYGEADYPYWFVDTDGDGDCTGDETSYSNAWASWTPRLMKATYNYQMATKDPGAFAHNAKYSIQLLFDSIEDLNSVASSPRDMATLTRDDPGHFNGAGEAARHWDEDITVSSSCSKCHGGADGLHFYLDYGVGLSDLSPDNGLECETCHAAIPEWTLVDVDSVTFPSGITLGEEGDSSNLCGTCHSGREAKASVDASIEAGDYGFENIHYGPGAATLNGADAQVGYEYDGKEYAGKWDDHSGGSQCNDCHSAENTNHTFQVTDNFEYCNVCHTTATTPFDIRNKHGLDYDGDGDDEEPLRDELGTIKEALLVQMNSVSDAAGDAICYDAHSYPYWFVDSDSSGGECDESEASYSNRYSDWTPELMKAAFNYQMATKDTGAWAHNFEYVAQLLIDSVEDMGGATDGYIRP